MGPLEVVHLSCGYRGRSVFRGVSLTAHAGEVLAVLKAIGVDYIQGFHLAEPCAIDDVFDCGN